MTIGDYIQALERACLRRDAAEHTHRPALKELLEGLQDQVTATNEPKRSECGAPDFVISGGQQNLTLGYVEAKDIGADLSEVEQSDQLKRYLGLLPNLILTDYLEFRWYVNGKSRGIARLATPLPSGRLAPVGADELAKGLNLLEGFLTQRPVEIASAGELAVRLAQLSHIIRDIIVEAFLRGHASRQLTDWRTAFARTLLPELAADSKEAVSEFADMFAQTLTYGFFSARASSLSASFSRDTARRLIPRTNPFLRSFFEQITGSALEDEPFAGFVEDVIQTLGHANMAAILEDFGKRGPRRDPVVHFYETFLQAYDPKLRELRGVYYTPEPVVNYIVQSIDRLLKDKFGLGDGLADCSKITCERREGGQVLKEESHRVLILDPATGTATFLYTVLDFIRSQFRRGRKAGQWGGYVHEHLLPRLFGFELLMAPYAVAHFKLGLALAAWDEEPLLRQQWSYEPRADERLNIFLTNTIEDLERAAEQLGPLRVLSDEANCAYDIKKHKPVLVVLGNPPYSGHSANKGKWIANLVRDYYFCDGVPLGERNPKWLQDDYVKFIRWAQWRIEQTGQGILGFITNHGYLDNPTFRGLRQQLMRAFDEIYLLDLHGSSKKKETVPGTGEQDKNVFDIQQGVAIGLFVKLPPGAKKKEKQPAAVRHADLWGAKRQGKYDWLDGHHVKNTPWTTLEPRAPAYLFIPQSKRLRAEYKRGWKVTEMMPVSVLGFQSHRDQFAIAFARSEIQARLDSLRSASNSDEALGQRYSLTDNRDWKLVQARWALLQDSHWQKRVTRCAYRPFDIRWCYFDEVAMDYPRRELKTHVLERENLVLNLVRQTKFPAWHHAFVSGLPTPAVFLEIKDGSSVFPLYLYPDGKLPEGDLFAHENERRPNLSTAFIRDLCERLGLKFVPDGLGLLRKKEAGPELVFNYAYAVFHSSTYRQRYAEFLRADFPRLPITSDFELFRLLAGFGGQLVDLHARRHRQGSGPGFPVKGTNQIQDVRYQAPLGGEPGRVWINDRQYFEGAPPAAWDFPIGGYRPAEKCLKDRLGRTLGYDDQTTYARIIHALLETARLMREIDQAIASHGGWPLR
jgi:hypothetical protein